MSDEMTGGCQCGRVRYRVRIADDEAYLCHCRMCQRATGGISIAFKNVKKEHVSWESEPDRFASSPIAQRGFCSVCGTPLTYEAHDHSFMDLTVGSFDDPARFRPTSIRDVKAGTATGLTPLTCRHHGPTRTRVWSSAGWIKLANFPTETHFFTAPDGVELAWTEMGPGGEGARAVVLIHGYFSNAEVNWIKYGHAAKLVERGFRVIMPDLRGHGRSAKPHDPAAYPPDVLMRDGMALIAHIGLSDYDLGGYSLGGRTVMRMLANGATPRRAVLSGMGLAGLVETQGRGTYFRRVLTNLGSFERGTPEWLTEAFLKTTKGDPQALLNVLATFVDTSEAEIAAIQVPTLVVTGVDDDDNGSGEAVADLLPQGRFVSIPGNHMSVVTRSELGQAIADFLSE